MMSENKKLIDLVKSYPILYDMKNKHYKDNIKKAVAWTDIGNRMNFRNGAVAKNKWRHLRDSYAKYLRTHSIVTGPSLKKYKHWTWACQMEFLKPHVTTRQTESNTVGIQSDGEMDAKIKMEPSLDELAQYYDDSQNEETTTPSRRRNEQQNFNFSVPDETIEYFQTGKLQRNMDAVDLLFLSYAHTLKTFSPRRQAAVKLQIAQIVNSAEMAQLEESDSLQIMTSSPTPSS